MSTTLRRRSALALATVLLAAAAVFGTAGAASADPILPINMNVNATTTIKSLGQTINISGGTFAGQVDLGNGSLTGDMNLPPASTDISLGAIRLLDTTFAMQQTQPVTGHVDLATLQVSATAQFNIRLSQLQAFGVPINLVGTKCVTASPITLNMSGTLDLTNGTTFSGTYTIPKFKDCGLLLTPIINLIIPSSGNMFSASLTVA